ncbi:MAG: efflux RND transporter periplasmic adaptor subunit [Chloroflexi bacterium]|nr:efflux RND transporter periplasmic adaptor subunit [Chloroflexota bacterium]
MSKRFRLILGGLLFLAAYAVLLGLSSRPRNILPTNDVQQPSAPQNSVKGKVTPRAWVELQTQIPARVEAALAAEGDQVEPGALLVRLEGHEQQVALVAAARLDLILANQAVEGLHRNAQVAYAANQAQLERARKELELAEDLVAGLQRPKASWQIAQAKANVMLAEYHLKQEREDLEKAWQRYRNKKHILWKFINQRAFKLSLTAQEKALTHDEQRYRDAVETYEELLKPVDEVDLILAEAREAFARARVEWLEREGETLAAGPHLEDMELAQARVRAAIARLAAAEAGLRQFEITAPFAGTVVAMEIKIGEYVSPGQRGVVLADLSHWQIDIDRLEDNDIYLLSPGADVEFSLDAYPGVFIHGVVEQISDYFTEEDESVYYHARIQAEKLPGGASWGMTARVRLSGQP